MKIALTLFLALLSVIPTLALANAPYPIQNKYSHLSGDEACQIFKEYRAITQTLRNAKADGALDLGMTSRSIVGLTATLGGISVAAYDLFNSLLIDEALLSKTVAAGLGVGAAGLALMFTDGNQQAIQATDAMLTNPGGLLARSDLAACSALHEYPALRIKIAEARDAADWVLRNRAYNQMNVSEATDTKWCPSPGADVEPVRSVSSMSEAK